MKATYIAWVLIAHFWLIAIVGWVVWMRTGSKRAEKTMYKFNIFGLSIFLVFGMLDDMRIYKYNMTRYQYFNQEYGLPQIDSCMYVYQIDDESITHIAGFGDSISHLSKVTNYDLFDVYDVTDEFRNRKTGANLSYYFIKPNIIRDSLRVVIFNQDTITKFQGDSILKEWHLYERAYTQWKPRY